MSEMPLGTYKGDHPLETFLTVRVALDRDQRHMVVVGYKGLAGRQSYRWHIPPGALTMALLEEIAARAGDGARQALLTGLGGVQGLLETGLGPSCEP